MVSRSRVGHVLGGVLPFIAVGLGIVPVLIPLLQTAALPCTHDNMFHLFRIVAMRAMLRHGWLFSRWVPNLALGYGYPFFNYREPLPYLAGEGLYAAGLPLPLVLGVLYAAGLVGAMWGAFILARDLFGRRAAWVSGLAYGLGPYLLMTALRRGNMPETVALALLPWLFVVMRRLILYGQRRTFLIAILLLAALFLSHNISSLLVAPFLGLYVTGLVWLHRDRRTWPLAYGAVILAVLLAAWFWLPALTEQDWVQLHLSRSTRNNDFHYNFVTWREMLLTIPMSHDPAYLNPPMRVYLGLGQGVLALIGLGVGWVVTRPRARVWKDAVRRERRFMLVLFGAGALIYLWMATPGAVWVWERISLLSFVQFPWRMVGRALLPVSLLAGLAVEGIGSLDRRDVGRWFQPTTLIVAAVMAGLVVASWPDTYSPKGICSLESYPDLNDLYALELDGWIGMDPENSYFPIWVENHPTSTALADAFVEGRLPKRLDAALLPDGTQVTSAHYRALGATLDIEAPAGFQARWLGLYFPGWEVRVDGEPVMVTPEDDTGLLLFPVPAGTHHIEVRFGSTAARTAGCVLAAAGGVLLLVVILLWRGFAARVPDARNHESLQALPAAEGPRFSWKADILLLAVGSVLLAVRMTVPVTQSRLDRGGLPEVATRQDQPFEGGLTLLGATLAEETLSADEELRVDLLWLARATPAVSYRMTVLLRGADGQVWSPAGTVRPRGYEDPPPTVVWQPGAYIYDPHVVTLAPGTPPGDYEVIVAVFDAETLAAASRLDTDNQPAGSDYVLGAVTVTRPKVVPSLKELEVPGGTLQSCCGVGLWAMAADREIGAPGDVVAVRWVWEALEAPGENVEVVLELMADGGGVLHQWRLPPVTAWWPTSAWVPGDRWVGRHVVRLPGDLDSGSYALQVRWPGCEAALGEVPLTIVAPERRWTVPEALLPQDIRFDDGGVAQVALAGYELAPVAPAAGDAIEVVLAWRAVTAMETSYHVFLHLLDVQGHIVAQSDGVPAAWTRPTTGWAEGEVVVEKRQVALPADAGGHTYTLRVGLYDPSGSRLTSAGNGDSFLLASFEVGW